jgi:hypothetical protein
MFQAVSERLAAFHRNVALGFEPRESPPEMERAMLTLTQIELVQSTFAIIAPHDQRERRLEVALERGVSSGFAAMAGLTAVPRLVESHTTGAGRGEVPFSALWVAAGLVVACAFVAVLGPGLPAGR